MAEESTKPELCGLADTVHRRSLNRNSSGAIQTGAAIAATAIGPGMISGGEITAFFAQTGSAARMGILCAGAIFAGIAAGLVYVRRFTGARSVPQLARRLPKPAGGAALTLTHGALMAAVAWTALESAARIGAILLPLRFGGISSAAAVLLAAILLALLSEQNQTRVCACAFGAFLIYIAALAGFGRPLGTESRYAEVELRLYGSVPAAVALAAIHACLRVCVAANALLRFAEPSESVWRKAFAAAAGYVLSLSIGVLAVRRQKDFAVALRQPLTAIAAGWGKAGFFSAAILTLIASTVTLYAALCPCFLRKNDVKL